MQSVCVFCLILSEEVEAVRKGEDQISSSSPRSSVAIINCSNKKKVNLKALDGPTPGIYKSKKGSKCEL